MGRSALPRVEAIRSFRRLGNQLWMEGENGKRQMIALAATPEMAGWMWEQIRLSNPYPPLLEWGEPVVERKPKEATDDRSG